MDEQGRPPHDPEQQQFAADAELTAAGIHGRLHDRLLALRGRLSGVDWERIVVAVRRYGPVALDVLEHLAEKK